MNRLGLLLLSTCIAASTIPRAGLAGPNAYGYLHFRTDESIVYTADDAGSYASYRYSSCEPPPDCRGPESECIAEVLSAPASSATGSDVAVFWLVAVFPYGCPRISGAQFGLTWPESDRVSFVDWGVCGDFELPTDGWPVERNSGVAVTWNEPQTQHAVPIYWFAAYAYDTVGRVSVAEFPLGPGTVLADDSLPAQLDTVSPEDRGVFGLNGGYGFNPFPGMIDPQDSIGSCCLPDGTCRAMQESTCENRDGRFLGTNVPCDPGCVTPILRMGWGSVKSAFRQEGDGER